MPIIGIDLGTTNSLAAVWKDGKCQLIPNALGEILTPSAVSIEENGNILVGRAAKDRLISHPERTAASFKRFMGTDTKLMLAGKPFTPIELSAFVLRRLKEDAEAFLGQPVEEAVISVPAYFDDNGRSATKAAGELAGFRVERIVNEPSAAALAYHKGKDEDMSFLVFDFGGGTLDVSIVDAFSNVIEIVAVAGDNHLGGDDFNHAIAAHFCKQNGLKLSELPRETQASLIRQAEQCKIALSSADPVMMVAEMEGNQRSVMLTNQKLVEILAPLLRRLERPIARVLRDCRDTVGEVDEVVLVGGSCHMPLIQQYLRHILGKAPLCDFHAETTVALGAGIAAGIKERSQDLRDTVLTDICPFTLGVNVINHEDPANDLFSPILERNTTLPASRMRSYFTAHDNQTKMTIEVYQGEGIYCRDNLKLGEVEIDVPRAARGQQGADVRFTYDINGILQVEVTCQSTGQKQQSLILNPNLKLSDKELKTRLQELEKYKFIPREEEENKTLLARGARLYAESTGLLREQIHQQIDYFNLLLHEGNESRLRRYRKDLTRFFDQIDAHMDSDDEILRAFRDGFDPDEDGNEDGGV
ncbi:MAG: molecular chaperone HscC [Butyricicoccus pullicaecorum]|nr:molecular chaperone HscC [Butyricicoccus pullicaecorum]